MLIELKFGGFLLSFQGILWAGTVAFGKAAVFALLLFERYAIQLYQIQLNDMVTFTTGDSSHVGR